MPDITDLSISELTPVASAADTDLFETSEVDGTDPSGYVSKRISLGVIADFIGRIFRFPSALTTTDKTIVGAINEVKADAGSDVSVTNTIPSSDETKRVATVTIDETPTDINADDTEAILRRVFGEHTVEGNPVTFDAYLGLETVKSLTLTMNPIQNLHGYDKPWPGGAGNNKWNEDWERGYISNIDGQNTDSQNHIRSKTFSVCESSTEYCFIKPAGQWFGVFWYSSDNSYIDFSVFASDAQKVITSPSNAVKFKICTGGASTPVTTYSGGVACNYPATVTTYAPYANICPISGRDSVDVVVTGKNQFNKNGTDTDNGYVDNNYLWSDGSLRSSTNWFVSEYIELLSALTISGLPSSDATNPALIFYTADKTFISGITYRNNPILANITIPNNAKYIRISVPKANKDTIQVETSITATAYEPYTAQTKTITFPSTIYGGTDEVVGGVGTSTYGYIASYNGETLPGYWISDRDVYAEGTTPTTGAEVCYELATPSPFNTAPTPIELNKGNNVVSSDADDLELTYSVG